MTNQYNDDFYDKFPKGTTEGFSCSSKQNKKDKEERNKMPRERSRQSIYTSQKRKEYKNLQMYNAKKEQAEVDEIISAEEQRISQQFGLGL